MDYVTDATNLGQWGASFFLGKDGSMLQFKRLLPVGGVYITETNETINLKTVFVQAQDPGAVGAGLIWVQP